MDKLKELFEIEDNPIIILRKLMEYGREEEKRITGRFDENERNRRYEKIE